MDVKTFKTKNLLDFLKLVGQSSIACLRIRNKRNKHKDFLIQLFFPLIFPKLDVLPHTILGRPIEALSLQTEQTNCRCGPIESGWQRKCFCAENDTVIT